jgi:hypothetical protein
MKTSQFPRRTLLGVSLSHLALVCGECSQNFLLLRLEYLEEVKRPLLRRTVLFGFSAGQIGLPAEAAIHVIPVPTLPLIVRQRHLLVEIAELDRVLAAGELQASSRVSAGGSTPENCRSVGRSNSYPGSRSWSWRQLRATISRL